MENEDQLNDIIAGSQIIPALLFKHSTRCGVSSTALNRLERNWKENDNSKINPCLLDLIKHRDLSNKIAQHFGIVHESPQVILIYKSKCVYSASHLDINYEDLMALSHS